MYGFEVNATGRAAETRARPLVAAVTLLAALGTACGDTSNLLVVQVRSDLVPLRELVAVEVEPVGEPAVRYEVSQGEDWIEGVRVAELLRDERVVRLQVRALGPGGELLVQRPISVTLTTTAQAVTVLLSRDCRGVTCEEPGAPSCRAGLCVADTCVEEAGCDPECTTGADCAPPAACAAVQCIQGACVYDSQPDGAACGTSSYCDADLGCRAPDEPQLLLHYSFEAALQGGARDSTGGGRDAECTACPTPGQGGPRGAHVCFDASPQWLEVPFEPRFAEPGPRTVAAWVRLDAPAPAQSRSFMSKPFGGDRDVRNSWELTISESRDSLQFVLRSAVDAQVSLRAPEPAPDRWVHVAGTWDPDAEEGRLYVDGTPVTTRAVLAPLAYEGESPIFIGADLNDGVVDSGFFGCLDDVRYYERALSADEIGALAAR